MVRTVDLEMPRYVPVRTPHIEVLEGPDAGMVLATESDRVMVGSANGNELQLSDDSVSRYHVELITTREGVSVVDQGSTNGTHIGELRIERALVPLGTVLKLGRTKLRIAAGKPSVIMLHDDDRWGGLMGRTPVMRRLMAKLQKAAVGELPILMMGESGTGKELIAQAIHEYGPRATGPFVTVDCGALAPNLVASELFGHERGAFTGAHGQRIGAFEQASGGTLFLDEIGELPADLQVNLLGVLERGQFRRVGGNRTIDVDVRIVSATNRNLKSDVNEGRFRLDLYYRLAVMSLKVPPLRERTEDIPLLIEHFLALHNIHRPVDDLFPGAALDGLFAHHWPGNVRELRNVVEATLAMGEAVPLTSSPPPKNAAFPVGLPYSDARAQVLHAFEAAYLRHLLEIADGNVSKAARVAHMNRSHLFTLLRRHQLR